MIVFFESKVILCLFNRPQQRVEFISCMCMSLAILTLTPKLGLLGKKLGSWKIGKIQGKG